eukprot:m.201367 g.201367  ORF g.201367 m.201367 type:complete len:786 (-) comp25963_c1_seq5:1366-3723(-)
MASWSVTYNGVMDMGKLALDVDDKVNLTDEAINMCTKLRKGKHEHIPMSLTVGQGSLQGTPSDNSPLFYQPIGKIIFLHSHTERALKKIHLFSYVASADGCRYGAQDATYVCHVFKCKSEEDAKAIVYATSRTMAHNTNRMRPSHGLEDAEQDDIEAAVQWWNASNQPMFHLRAEKDGTVVGNMKFFCQVDKTLKAVAKVVRVTSKTTCDDLIPQLAEKFNLGNINLRDYSIFDMRDNTDQHMLENEASPISACLQWSDPAEGKLWLKKLPNGLVRAATIKKREDRLAEETQRKLHLKGSHVGEIEVDQQTTRSADSGNQQVDTNSSAASDRTQRRKSSQTVEAPQEALEHQPDHSGANDLNGDLGLGQGLTYYPEEEDMLLEVMIGSKSADLGFPLTVAYLLQMIIAHCAEFQGVGRLKQLFIKIAERIAHVVGEHPNNPAMLLFWSTNILKLSSTLEANPFVQGVFTETVKDELDRTLTLALKSLKMCAASGLELPAVVEKADWNSLNDLFEVVENHCQALVDAMDPQTLQSVVDRIRRDPAEDWEQEGYPPEQYAQYPPDANYNDNNGYPPEEQNYNDHPDQFDPNYQRHPQDPRYDPAQQPQQLEQTPVIPMAATLQEQNSADELSAIHQPEDDAIDDQHPVGPLPPEWQELVDQETKHRFFANHNTRQTSWTDPRDRLITVVLVKGDRGLGLGITGAKRTYDNRLVLGIFVSSLVEESAAAIEGTLREGDEILEVNGQSLIGVNREGAIEYLKQVKHGDSVELLVSQEPRPNENAGHTSL